MASNGQLYSMLYDNVMKLLTTGKIVPDQLGSEIQKCITCFKITTLMRNWMKKSFYAKLYAILAFLKGLPKFSRITVTTENGSLKNDQKYNGFSGDDTKIP